jgi:hypothetical protein
VTIDTVVTETAANVVQHIFTYQREHDGTFASTFTKEWPVTGVRHQLSYTLPYSGTFDDLAINYRYQLARDGDARLAIAPRVSYLVRDRAMQVNPGVARALAARGDALERRWAHDLAHERSLYLYVSFEHLYR